MKVLHILPLLHQLLLLPRRTVVGMAAALGGLRHRLLAAGDRVAGGGLHRLPDLPADAPAA